MNMGGYNSRILLKDIVSVLLKSKQSVYFSHNTLHLSHRSLLTLQPALLWPAALCEEGVSRTANLPRKTSAAGGRECLPGANESHRTGGKNSGHLAPSSLQISTEMCRAKKRARQSSCYRQQNSPI